MDPTLPPDRPVTRVLLECAEHDDPAVIAGVLRRAGYEVTVCTGPEHHRCDLLARGSCDRVDDAEVVVNLLSTRAGDEIAATVATARAGRGVVVEVGVPSSGRPEVPSWPSDVELVRTPITAEALLAAVERAARPRQPA